MHNMDETTRLQHRDSVQSENFWSERTVLEKALLVFLIIVVAVGIALSISLASYKKEHCMTHPDADADICETPECVRSAAYLISSMNTSEDPCENFFSFACGGYLKKTFLLGNRVGRFTKLSVNILLRMKELLEEPFREDDPWHWNKTKSFYNACMDLADRQNRRGTPLAEQLNDLGKWPLLSDEWEASYFSWNETLKMMFNKGYNKDILMKIDIDLDLKNSSKALLTVDQPLLAMPRIFYLLEEPLNYALVAYKMFIFKCSRYLNRSLNTDETVQQINDAVDIEIRLAKASLPVSERKNFAELYVNHITTLERLEEDYGGIPWRDLINSFLPKHVSLNGKEEIWTPVPSAISELHAIVRDQEPTTKRKLANYMMYRLVLMAAPDLSHAFRQSFYDFHDVLTGKPYSYPEPWQECVDVTGLYFFYSLSSVYTRKYFQLATKENVSSIERNIKEVLQDEIKDASWIDDATQDAALLKAEKMRAIIGYPEDILNSEILNDFSKKLPVGNTHYENVREAYKFYALRRMEGLHEIYDKHRWDATGNLLMANAFYSPTRNTITIPVGVLQEETYNAEKPNYLNYGSLGMLLGHELTHGFDMTGSQFDEQGDWKFWWTNETYEELRYRSECFVKQYNAYAVPGTNKTINGTLTLNENMADTGGLRAAYKAYQRWVEGHGKEKILPGLPYTPNQLFWLSFASVWCSKETPEHLLHTIMFLEHAPPRYRVQGTVSNLKEFSTDFNCQKESVMNPDGKCSLWT